MGLGLGLGAAAILWLADQLSLDRQRTQIEGLVALSADRLADMARRATHDVMLRNDAEGVRRMVDEHRRPGGRRLASASTTRRAASASRPSPPRRAPSSPIRSEECIACHAGPQPKAGLERGDRIRMLRAPDGERILGIITPIYNEPACTACHVHPASQRVLGVLDVRLSMAQADAMVRASERQLTYGLLATGAAVVGLSFLLLWALVLRPVKRLPPRHGARRGRRPLGARPRALEGRDGRARPLLERHDRRPAARPRRASRA